MDTRYVTIANTLGLSIPDGASEIECLHSWYKTGQFCTLYQRHQSNELPLPSLLKKCLSLYYHMSAGIVTHDVYITRDIMSIFGTKAWFKLYCENAMHKNPPFEYDIDVLNDHKALFEEYTLWLSARLAPKGNTVALAFLTDENVDIHDQDKKPFGDALLQWAIAQNIGCSNVHRWPTDPETSPGMLTC